MILAEIDGGNLLWSLVAFFFMVVYFMILFNILFDLFRDTEESGVKKALWLLFMFVAPLFGPLIKKVAVARFTRTLGTLVASGVPILDSLDIVARTAGNLVIEEEILKAKQSISEGKRIAEPLRDSKVFPGMMVQMVAVGEETGSMEAMLTKVADFYDDQVDAAVGALTSMLEPVMLVGGGGSVGAILIAMYLPIFTIADSIH